MPIRGPAGRTRLGRLARRAAPLLALALLGFALADCASPPRGEGVVHTVQAGENLYRISRYYGVSVGAIRAANEIDDVRELAVGERLWIPGSHAPPPPHPLTPMLEALHSPRYEGPAPHFSWPLRGRLTSPFGWRGRRMHEGIDIAGAVGSPVRAAAPGQVIFSGRLGGYGNVVIVQHERGFASVYAHNRRNRVAKGARVQKGDLLAELGTTGRTTGPHLHFEIRRQEHPQDPLAFLP